MSQVPSELVTVIALCQILLEALDRLEDDVASEAPIADLRRFHESAQAELERRQIESW